MAPVITARRLTKTYPGGRCALDGVDLEIPGGQLVALIGANGAGKSTLFKAIFGILQPDEGSLEVLGLNPATHRRTLHSLAGYASQSPALDPELTGWETLRLLTLLCGAIEEHVHENATRIAEIFGIKDRLGDLTQTYSGGLKQRLHLAGAFVHNPRLLLLDEPTNGLDPQGQADIWHLLKERTTRGASALVATHDLANADRHCHQIVLMADGRILAHDSPGHLIEKFGRSLLEIRFREGLEEDTLRKLLNGNDQVDRAGLQGNTATITLSQQDSDGSAVLKAIRGTGIAIQSYQHKAPDLESVYFHLTGSRVSPRDKAAQPGANRKGKG